MEKLSKFISYILRHNPKEENLNFDEFGWLKFEQFFRILENHNFFLELPELIKLNNSFDKIRWEIDCEKNRIRATHGHSFPIILTNQTDIPPEILYHGTSAKSLWNITNHGLLSMQREYVHLSDSIEIAYEVAKRNGIPIILEIKTETMLKNGFEFFRTQNNIWLTQNIDKKFIEINPWSPVNNVQNLLINQFKSEVFQNHELYSEKGNMKVIWRSFMNDDILLENTKTKELYDLHLTYSNNINSKYPRFVKYNTFEDWVENKLHQDQKEYYS